ncbi:MAG: MBL fold metallo-hydrolase [Gammaproteobacteria bacterium]
MKKKILLVIVFVLCPSVLLHAQGPQPDIRVTLLGTGVPLKDPVAYLASGRVTAGLLIQAGSERMLFDCGQGVTTRLLQSGGPDAVDPNIAVDKVFLSHLHSDHIAELPSLYSYAWPFRGDKPLRVWGPDRSQNQPVGTVAMMRSFRVAFTSDFRARCCLFTNPEENLPLSGITLKNNVFNLTPGVAYDHNGVTVTAFRVDHDPVIPAFGFRIDYNGRSVVYSGDTTVSQNLIEHSLKVNVLIHEVYGFPRDVSPGIFDYHTSPEQAAGVFKSTVPTMAVYTHIANPTTDDDLVARTRAAGYTGPLTVGLDLMQITVMPDGAINIIPPPAGTAGVP